MSALEGSDFVLPFYDSKKIESVDAAKSLKSIEWLLGLTDLDGIGNRRALLLAEHFQDIDSLMSASKVEVSSVIGSVDVDFSRANPIMPHVESDVRTVSYFDSEYPQGLKDLRDAPLVLWYRGSIPTGKSIAIVGTREADEWGKAATRKLAAMASEHGLSVVSGLALGVDAEAHRGSLEGGGPTVAILACDVRYPAPKANHDLAEKIVQSGGCLIAEVPLGTETEGRNLVARNRLQAAWAQSLLVTQSGVPSGTLHTVRFALELDRKVLVLKAPLGAVGSQYAGNNALTRENAFDPEMLKGTKKFIESMKGRKVGADISIGALSEFESFLENVI